MRYDKLSETNGNGAHETEIHHTSCTCLLMRSRRSHRSTPPPPLQFLMLWRYPPHTSCWIKHTLAAFGAVEMRRSARSVVLAFVMGRGRGSARVSDRPLATKCSRGTYFISELQHVPRSRISTGATLPQRRPRDDTSAPVERTRPIVERVQMRALQTVFYLSDEACG